MKRVRVLKAALTAAALAASLTAVPPHFEAFVPTLKLQELPVRLYQMKGVLRFYSIVAGGVWIEVPEGFITDECSIPRLPLVYLFAGGKADEAGDLHDWLYTTRMFPREVCDAVLREAVVAMGYSQELADSMYQAVRLFGQSHWDLQNQPQPAYVQVIIDTYEGKHA